MVTGKKDGSARCPQMNLPENNYAKVFLLFACDGYIIIYMCCAIIWILSNRWRNNNKMRGKHSLITAVVYMLASPPIEIILSVSSDLGVAFEFLLPFYFMNIYSVSNWRGMDFFKENEGILDYFSLWWQKYLKVYFIRSHTF